MVFTWRAARQGVWVPLKWAKTQNCCRNQRWRTRQPWQEGAPVDRTNTLGDGQKDNSFLGTAGWPILRYPGTKRGLIPGPTPKRGGGCGCGCEMPYFWLEMIRIGLALGWGRRRGREAGLILAELVLTAHG